MGIDSDDSGRPRRRKRPVQRRRGPNPVVIVSVVMAVFVIGGLAVWGGIYLFKLKADTRLIGTWQSDAEATIEQRKKTHPEITEQNIAAMRKLFGKMKLTYTAKTYSYDLMGETDTQPYQIVGKDAESVTIKSFDKSSGKEMIWRIRFIDSDTYWVDISNEFFNLSECFRRVK